MHRFIVLLLLAACSTPDSITDNYSDTRIDTLFDDWNAPGHPGGAVGIMKDGEVIYSKAFGLASLEYEVPNTTGTIFNTGSVSKQFTAMGIVVLELQGKLSVDDDIRTYLPFVPDFGQTITIRHLMHHTSGLRSLHALFELGGWRGDDSRTNEDLNRIIQLQQDLNFNPGDEYLYCNTGYMLMATIIEEISGETFPVWMKKNVFHPLGMDDTYVEDEYYSVVPNNATSYYGNGDNFVRAVEYWGYVGSGNMHSTTGDLLRWLKNFHDPQNGWAEAFERMQTLTPFNDGTPNEYAFGVTVSENLGEPMISHGGAIGGFRAFAASYPEAGLDIAVLTNYPGGNPGGKAQQIAEILLQPNAEAPASGDAPEFIGLSSDQLARLEGHYWNPREKYSRKIYVRDDTLRYSRSENNENPIMPLDSTTFRMLGIDPQVATLTFSDGGLTFESAGSLTSVFERYELTEPTRQELDQYIGTYYSDEVETFYRVMQQGDSLVAYHPRRGILAMERLFRDTFYADWPLGVVEVVRDDAGVVNGILISNGRVRNAWFARQPEVGLPFNN